MIINSIKKLTKKDIIFTIVTAIIILIINIIISYLFTFLKIRMENQEMILEVLNSSTIITSVSTIFLAPLLEELVFRYAIGTIINNKILFVIVSSILFALFHGLGIVTLLYVLLGCGFSLIYLKTNKNITAPILAHIINNAFSIITSLI